MKRRKMTKDIIPDDFTLSLALVDAIPVLFFGASMIVLSRLLHNTLFLIGALLVLFAGAAKVLWKIIVVLKHQNIWALFIQMRILMPIGFVLILLSFVVVKSNVDYALLKAAALSMPSVLFFGLGLAGMVCMLIFGFTLDSSNVKANWVEQCTNGLAQICIFIGLLLML